MRHTLKAAFDRQSDAQHVLDELLASGYSGADLTLSNTPPAGLATSIEHTIGRLFASRQQKQAMASPGVVVQGHHLVTLTADSELDAERAVAIIERFGATGIEDIHDEWVAGRMRPVYRTGTEPGALQARPHEDRQFFGTQAAGSPPTGNTFQELMGATMPWDYRNEEAARAGVPEAPTGAISGSDADDDHLAAAYRHGSDAAQDSDYRDRHWDDVEHTLKLDWLRRHAGNGPSAWNKVKAAVRHGWERMKS
jgi:hypothetical protein